MSAGGGPGTESPEDRPEERLDAGRSRGPTDGDPAAPVTPVVGNPEGEVPGGPFRSWPALYLTVVAWAAGWIVLLWVLTATLNVGHGGAP